MLTPEELAQVLPAETSSFPSPVPTQIVSNDEYMPSPQTEKQRQYEARIKALGTELARKHGTVLLSGRGFEGPPWSARVSLANLSADEYLDIGRDLAAIAGKAVAAWKAGGGEPGVDPKNLPKKP